MFERRERLAKACHHPVGGLGGLVLRQLGLLLILAESLLLRDGTMEARTLSTAGLGALLVGGRRGGRLVF